LSSIEKKTAYQISSKRGEIALRFIENIITDFSQIRLQFDLLFIFFKSSRNSSIEKKYPNPLIYLIPSTHNPPQRKIRQTVKLWFFYVSITRKNHREHKVSRSEIFCHFLPSKKTHWIIPVKKKNTKGTSYCLRRWCFKRSSFGVEIACCWTQRAGVRTKRPLRSSCIYKKEERLVYVWSFSSMN